MGNAACAECHTEIHKEHGVSRHNLALCFVDEASLGKDAPPLGTIPETNVEVKRTEKGLVYGPKG